MQGSTFNAYDKGPNNNGTKGIPFDVNDINKMLQFSDKVASGSCVLANLYAQAVLSGVTGIQESFGDFYMQALTTKPEKRNAYVVDYLNMSYGVGQYGLQKSLDAMFGNDTFKVEGYFVGDSEDIYDNMFNPSKNGTSNFPVVRFNNGNPKNGHNMLLHRDNTGKLNSYDIGRPGNIRGPRDYGSDPKSHFDPENVNYYYWIKKK